MKHRILLIDDEPAFAHKIQVGFPEYSFIVQDSLEQSLESVESQNTELILLDLNLNPATPVLDGLEFIKPFKERYPEIPLIVVTADERTETVVTAMKLGADDFLRKSSFDLLSWKKKFDLHIENRKLLLENRKLKSQESQSFPFIGISPEIQEIKKTLDILAETPDVTVLITGETGVGKEMAARYLHQKSKRRDKPFVSVNLPAIPETLLESSLFGHKKGAFTGATYQREGYFSRANHGILFLDEIGDIGNGLQAKLLRFLETKSIQAVGDEQDINLDVQIIVATNQNLKELVEQNRFRADLYYRIKNFQIEIPPLRHRPDDIEPIFFYYLKKAGYNEPESILDSDVIARLKSYEWPGNVRELKNTVDAMLLRMKVHRKSRIDLSCLPDEIREDREIKHASFAVPQAFLSNNDKLKNRIAHSELSAIEEALKKTYGQKQAAANLLGLSADQMRYRVLKWWKVFPQAFEDRTYIKKYYRLKE